MVQRETLKAEKSAGRFFGALRDVFVGAKVEGESGYLMRIKSRYYTEGVFPREIELTSAWVGLRIVLS